jgi:hypothetical protein
MPYDKACDYYEKCGAVVVRERVRTVNELCATIGSARGGPFTRITIAGHCGGTPDIGVKLCEKERFDCSSLTRECAETIKRALLPGGILRIFSCGYLGDDEATFMNALKCIAAKVSPFKVCACYVKGRLYRPEPEGATICQWKCLP